MKVDLTPSISLTTKPDNERLRKPEIGNNGGIKLAGESQKQHEPVNPERPIPPVVLNHDEVRLQFRVDEESGEKIIQIFDSETGEMVRQIPPEELLRIMKTLRDLRGLLLSKVT